MGVTEIVSDWTGEPCIVVASGPSLDADTAHRVRMARWTDGWRVIVVNDAYRLLPRADILYACDARWWELHEGAPVSALLVQGGGDAKFPAAGGLDETGREAHASFRAKVDYWRLVTGTSAAAAQAVDVPALDPNAPADLEALSYDAGGPTVIEILDPGLEHAWPDWDVMLVAKRLFEG